MQPILLGSVEILQSPEQIHAQVALEAVVDLADVPPADKGERATPHAGKNEQTQPRSDRLTPGHDDLIDHLTYDQRRQHRDPGDAE
jgi:hypothetical protein